MMEGAGRSSKPEQFCENRGSFFVSTIPEKRKGDSASGAANGTKFCRRTVSTDLHISKTASFEAAHAVRDKYLVSVSSVIIV